MKNVLIISGHTDLAASVANRTILDTLSERLPGAEIVKLDELYPDFKIDVEAEQQKLLRADIIVLQFPLFWYSAPQYWNAGWKKHSATVSRMEARGTNSRERSSFSPLRRECPRRCIAMRERWATLSMIFWRATKPPVG